MTKATQWQDFVSLVYHKINTKCWLNESYLTDIYFAEVDLAACITTRSFAFLHLLNNLPIYSGP